MMTRKRRHRVRKRILAAAGAATLVLATIDAITACTGVVSTRRLADAFNGGALDGTSDPFYPRSRRVTDSIVWRMREELDQAYFEQGSGDAPVVQWLRRLATQSTGFVEGALASPDAGDWGPAGEGSGEGAPAKETPPAQRKLRAGFSRVWASDADRPRPETQPLCDSDGNANHLAIHRLADDVRFEVALAKATDDMSHLVQERFATLQEANEGAKRAFEQTATYLAHRQWQRTEARHVTGLVVKGGAATGIFSAGVVYVALNLLDACVSSGECKAGEVGFDMASGTSTGATIVTAVDAFHSALVLGDAKARLDALNVYRDLYLCSSINDLYCVRNSVAFDLARSHAGGGLSVLDSFLDFNGLASKAQEVYKCPEMNNRMELVLNAVDFRTGRLYALSDQDPSTLRTPWDVAKAVVSSAALPFIVRPTYGLPVDPVDGGAFAYLDGGIRSELPLLALVRRGVERVLVVSSSAPVTADVAAIGNALNMAIRYIDISTGGVTESELDHAHAYAVATRLAEYEQCRLALSREPSLCSGKFCNADRLCAGDWADACKPGTKVLSNQSIVEQTFQTTNVWRDEDHVPGLPGYAFDPNAQRRLMLAGIEAAREQCKQVASALDIHVPDEKLYEWCSPRLPTNLQQCGKARLDQAKKSSSASNCANDEGPRPTPDAGSTAECSPRLP